MKAIQIRSTGGPEVMELVELPEPSPGPGQAVVKLHAIGVNFVDVYHRVGIYPSPLPLVLGSEGAGEVTAVGTGVAGLRVGDRVVSSSIPGAYAEHAAVPADRLVPVPKSISYETAAAVILQGMTAHYLVNDTYPLKKGESCLIHAAAGGVGLLLVQLAKRAGARVIGTVSTEEKAALAREAGADEVILYGQVDFAQEVKRLTDGAGVEVVYDSVGKTTFDRSLTCLKPRGYLVLYGQSSGKVPPFDPGILSQGGSLFLTRPSLGNYTADRAGLERRSSEIFRLTAQGKLKVHIGATFALAEAPAAHRSLEGRKTTGKVLLVP